MQNNRDRNNFKKFKALECKLYEKENELEKLSQTIEEKSNQYQVSVSYSVKNNSNNLKMYNRVK